MTVTINLNMTKDEAMLVLTALNDKLGSLYNDMDYYLNRKTNNAKYSEAVFYKGRIEKLIEAFSVL
jgi:hypothetical protein